MKRIKTWPAFKKYFQTTECMVMVALLTDMDCQYHPVIYTKRFPSGGWHCYCNDGLSYKGPNGYSIAKERAMELFHLEFDKDNPIEINYSDNNNLMIAGNYVDETKMKEEIIDCLKLHFPELTIAFL